MQSYICDVEMVSDILRGGPKGPLKRRDVTCGIASRLRDLILYMQLTRPDSTHDTEKYPMNPTEASFRLLHFAPVGARRYPACIWISIVHTLSLAYMALSTILNRAKKDVLCGTLGRGRIDGSVTSIHHNLLAIGIASCRGR